MISPEILKKIKEIEIYTRRLLTGSLVGDSRSAIKGSGMEFDQIREYQMGDDVRFIDWKASARMNKLLVKQYIEERNRTILLAVDVSASTVFASDEYIKSDRMAEVASVLALVADYGKDHVGLILFSDEVEVYLPPKAGRNHVHEIMQKLFSHRSHKKNTNITVALNYAAHLKRKDTMLFVLSDFICVDFSKSLRNLVSKYDVVAVRCLDDNEKQFPCVGFLSIEDSETGQSTVINAQSHGLQDINIFLEKYRLEQDLLFAKSGVDCIDITNNKHFLDDLISFFRRRMRY